jgi:O-acetyl-ADP-ribose deacetylase (regulator of RNase III)
MIKFVTGDFFDYAADIRVNTVNCVGVMGAGVALQFKNRFPKMYEEYVRTCEQGSVKPGHPHVWRDSNFFDGTLTIVNFPTKDHWRNPSEYDYIEKGLSWLRTFLDQYPSSTVTLPALGCGHGGLDWGIVSEMIIKHLDSIKATVLVFEPASSNPPQEKSAATTARLNEEKVVSILPSDDLYPARLKGRSSDNLQVKGNLRLLGEKKLSVIVDSRATDREKEAIIKCIEELPSNQFTYLMGFGSSLEIDLVRKILESKAKAILTIPYGVLSFKIRSDLKSLWSEDNIVLLSAAKPTEKWSNHASIGALRLRLQLADVTLIGNHNFEILNKYEDFLKEVSTPLFYLNYWHHEVDFYRRINAKQIGRNKNTQLPNMSPILDAIRT